MGSDACSFVGAEPTATVSFVVERKGKKAETKRRESRRVSGVGGSGENSRVVVWCYLLPAISCTCTRAGCGGYQGNTSLEEQSRRGSVSQPAVSPFMSVKSPEGEDTQGWA